MQECEEVFQDEKAQIFPDFRHSQREERKAVLGVTKQGKLLRISFTVRRKQIRVISARPIIEKNGNCMAKGKKKKEFVVPAFKNEDDERDFWDKVDLSDYFDKSDMRPVMFPNLKPTSASVSIRIPQYLLMRVKGRANALDVPYQSLMKQYIARGVSKDK